MASHLRPQFERDLDDALIFVKEVLIVGWRFNPAGVAAYSCNQLFGAISEDTPPDQKAELVTEVLGSIEISPVEQFEADFSNAIAEICKGLSSETIKGAITEYPDLEEFLTKKIGSEGADLESSFTRMTLSAISKHRDHYQQLHAHFTQLAEYLPRYSSIMTRTGFLDGVIGFAAGFFGGYLGAAGAEAWGNWRNSGDEEFCQKFGAAFEQFAQECFQYTNEGEESVSVILDRLIDEMRRIDRMVFDCYDELAETGWDIAPLYKRYRTLDEELDEDTRELFGIALSNLEENRSIHFRTIENIREMMGLNTPPKSSPPPLPHSNSSTTPINEAAQPEIDPAAQSNSYVLNLKFIQDVIGRFSGSGFYLGDEAPEKKVKGALGSYAPQVPIDQVLLICDNTIFGSAKDGLLITPTSIHWRNSGEGARFLPLDSIESVSVEESSSIFKLAHLSLNNEQIEVNGETVKERNEIAHQLRKIIETNKIR